MPPDQEQLVRDRAYAIWQADGCPDGREAQHWRQALLDVAEVTSPGVAEQGSAAADDAASAKAPARKMPARRKPPGEAAAVARPRKPKA